MMWKDYVIWYCNPNGRLSKMKILNRGGGREIIKARNKEEAERKAAKRLRTTGVIFNVEEIE